MGILSVVGTPIGNLGDMTYRAVETLEKADFICAEDTRVTAKLLNYFDIKTPLVSYHEHNAKQVGESILNRIMAGENAAIVTDAGMPCISDPGELLVKLCAENGVKVEVVPGPSAVVSALAISGLDTARFQFEGFLSTTKKQRLNHLASVKNCTNTLIFYEAPHKLLATLKDMAANFGENRRVSLCRELTKLHEEVVRTTLGEAVARYTENPPRGEFVVVVEGAQEAPIEELSIEAGARLVRAELEKGLSKKDAVKLVAKQTGLPRNALYEAALQDEA